MHQLGWVLGKAHLLKGPRLSSDLSLPLSLSHIWAPGLVDWAPWECLSHTLFSHLQSHHHIQVTLLSASLSPLPSICFQHYSHCESSTQKWLCQASVGSPLPLLKIPVPKQGFQSCVAIVPICCLLSHSLASNVTEMKLSWGQHPSIHSFPPIHLSTCATENLLGYPDKCDKHW